MLIVSWCGSRDIALIFEGRIYYGARVSCRRSADGPVNIFEQAAVDEVYSPWEFGEETGWIFLASFVDGAAVPSVLHAIECFVVAGGD